MAKAKLIQGNQACAYGALDAGVRFFAGYPITPSTEIAEILSKELPRLDGTFMQMEDEIASMGAILGASLAGVKSITATSGPGFSLKQELIGFGAMAEIPAVVINVQRVGPSTGQPTSPAQGDVMQARWGSHGDKEMIVIAPGSVLEAYTLMIEAVNLSEEYRIPVVFLMDEVIGHMRESVELPNIQELAIVNRKPLEDGQLPYQPLENGVAPMFTFGQGEYFHVTGLGHDAKGFPSSNSIVTKDNVDRIHQKVRKNIKGITRYLKFDCEEAEWIIIAYGGTTCSAVDAFLRLREEGVKVGVLQLQTLWPFPKDIVKEVCANAKGVLFAEMNYGQLVGEVEKILGDKVVALNRYDGKLILPQEIMFAVAQLMEEGDEMNG